MGESMIEPARLYTDMDEVYAPWHRRPINTALYSNPHLGEPSLLIQIPVKLVDMWS